MKSNKGQVTVYVILGILLVILLGVFFVTTNKQTTDDLELEAQNLDLVANVKSTVQSYAQNCLKDLTTQALLEYGLDYTNDLTRSYIYSHIDACLDFEMYENQGFIVQKSYPYVNVNIESEKIFVDLEYEFTLERDNTKYDFEKFSYSTSRTSFIALDNGIANKDITLPSSDNDAVVFFPTGTRVMLDGAPVDKVSIKSLDSNFNNQLNAIVVGGVVYDIEPDGAVIEGKLELTLHFDPSDLREDYDYNNLAIAYYNEETGIWNSISTKVNVDDLSLTANLEHFSIYGIVVGCSDSVERSILPMEIDLGFIYLPKWWPMKDSDKFYDPRNGMEDPINKELCEWTKATYGESDDQEIYYIAPSNDIEVIEFNMEQMEVRNNEAPYDEIGNVEGVYVTIQYEQQGEISKELDTSEQEPFISAQGGLEINPNYFHSPDGKLEMRSRIFSYNYGDEDGTKPVKVFVRKEDNKIIYLEETICQWTKYNSMIELLFEEYSNYIISGSSVDFESKLDYYGLTSISDLDNILYAFGDLYSIKNSEDTEDISTEISESKLKILSTLKYVPNNYGQPTRTELVLPECEERYAYKKVQSEFSGEGSIHFYLNSQPENTCLPEKMNHAFTEKPDPIFEDFGTSNSVLVYVNPIEPVIDPQLLDESGVLLDEFSGLKKNTIHIGFIDESEEDIKNVCPQVETKIFFDDGINVAEPPIFYLDDDERLEKLYGDHGFIKGCTGMYDGPNGYFTSEMLANKDEYITGDCYCTNPTDNFQRKRDNFNDCCFLYPANSLPDTQFVGFDDKGNPTDDFDNEGKFIPNNNQQIKWTEFRKSNYCVNVRKEEYPSWVLESESELTCYGVNDGVTDVWEVDKNGNALDNKCHCTPTQGGQRQDFNLRVCCDAQRPPGLSSFSYFQNHENGPCKSTNADGELYCKETTEIGLTKQCTKIKPDEYYYSCVLKSTEEKYYCCSENDFMYEYELEGEIVKGCGIEKNIPGCRDVSPLPIDTSLINFETTNSKLCKNDNVLVYQCDEGFEADKSSSPQLCVAEGFTEENPRDLIDCTKNELSEVPMRVSGTFRSCKIEESGGIVKRRYECTGSYVLRDSYDGPTCVLAVRQNLELCRTPNNDISSAPNSDSATFRQCLNGNDLVKYECVSENYEYDSTTGCTLSSDYPECIRLPDYRRIDVNKIGNMIPCNEGGILKFECPENTIINEAGDSCDDGEISIETVPQLASGDCIIHGEPNENTNGCDCDPGFNEVTLSDTTKQCIADDIDLSQLPRYTGRCVGGLSCGVEIKEATQTCLNGNALTLCCTLGQYLDESKTCVTPPQCLGGSAWNSELKECVCSGNAIYEDGACKPCRVTSVINDDKTSCVCHPDDEIVPFNGDKSFCIRKSIIEGGELNTLHSGTCPVSLADNCLQGYLTNSELNCISENRVVSCCGENHERDLDEKSCVDDVEATPDPEPDPAPVVDDTCNGGKIDAEDNCIYCLVPGDVTSEVTTMSGSTYKCSWLFGYYWKLQCADGLKDNGKGACVCKKNSHVKKTYDWGDMCHIPCTKEGEITENKNRLCYDGVIEICTGNFKAGDGTVHEIDESTYTCKEDIVGWNVNK